MGGGGDTPASHRRWATRDALQGLASSSARFQPFGRRAIRWRRWSSADFHTGTFPILKRASPFANARGGGGWSRLRGGGRVGRGGAGGSQRSSNRGCAAAATPGTTIVRGAGRGVVVGDGARVTKEPRLSRTLEEATCFTHSRSSFRVKISRLVSAMSNSAPRGQYRARAGPRPSC